MKALRFISLVLAFTTLISCSDPVMQSLEKKPGKPTIQAAAEGQFCLTTLIGDKDGFGRGLKQGDPLYLPAGTSLPLDWRSNDPAFTDIYPADIDARGLYTTHVVQFTIDFPVNANIQSATLHLNTLGIQDGDSQVYGSDTDIKLFIDGEELLGAFDSVDQFDAIEGKWSDFVSGIDIAIPTEMLLQLKDGRIELRWEILQTVPGMPSCDGFAIDYCELTTCSSGDNH